MKLHNNKNFEIESLRALSILLVLVAHARLLSPFIYDLMKNLLTHASFGVGVDLFFCISGYVVSKKYYSIFDDSLYSNNFRNSVKLFWTQRFYRLFPSAWFWVFVVLFCSIFFNSSGAFLSPEQNLKSIFSILSISSNISHMYSWLAPNNVYWSLALEEQFYLLFPFFFLFVKNKSLRIYALFAIIFIQFFLYRNHFGNIYEQYFASFRVDGFAWGILIYIYSESKLYVKLEPTFLRNKNLSFLITLFLIYLLVAVPAVMHAFSFSMGLLAFIAALIVLLASYDKGYIFGFTNLINSLQWLGSRSYGIYLIHLFAFKFIHECIVRWLIYSDKSYTSDVVPYAILFSAILIALLAEFNYKYLEQPMIRYGKNFANIRMKSI